MASGILAAIYKLVAPTLTDKQEHPLLLDSSGNLKTVASGTPVAGLSEYVDGATFTPATSVLAVVGGEVDDTSPATVAEGKAGAVRITPLRALHATQPTWVAGGSIADASTAYQLATLTSGTGLVAVPDNGALGLLEIDITGDSTPALATVKLTRDSAGDLVMAGPVSVALEVGATTSTTKTASLDLNRIPYQRGNIGTSGSLYAWVKVDAVGAGPTVTTVRLHGEYRG